jgi:hypothetical protein
MLSSYAAIHPGLLGSWLLNYIYTAVMTKTMFHIKKE